MTYRTTCPQCASVFRLDADQLGAAQGWVQCSVCGAAFDAHPALLMEDGSPLSLETASKSTDTATLLQPETLPPVAHEVTATASEASPSAKTPTEHPPEVESPNPRGIAQREASLDLPSIILIDPEIPVSDDPGPLPQIYPAPATPRSRPAAPPSTPPVTTPPSARIEYATPSPRKMRTPPLRRRTRPWIWGMVSAWLLVVLLAQTSYILRDTLTSQFPQTRPALKQACAILGCTLSLPKNPALLQIIGSDLQTEASGRLKLTLTLGNRAGHAQAWPMLILTLTDQRNRPLARRSFAPSEYLDDTQRITAGIPPRSEQVLTLPLSVNNLTPMGFELKLTY